jgi:hypothetical protein
MNILWFGRPLSNSSCERGLVLLLLAIVIRKLSLMSPPLCRALVPRCERSTSRKRTLNAAWVQQVTCGGKDPGLTVPLVGLSFRRGKRLYRRRDKRLNLPVEGPAGPLLNTRVQELDYGSGNELGGSLGALSGARTPTGKADTVQGTRHRTRVRNKEMLMLIQPT